MMEVNAAGGAYQGMKVPYFEPISIFEDQPHWDSSFRQLPLKSWASASQHHNYSGETQTEHAMRITEEFRGR